MRVRSNKIQTFELGRGHCRLTGMMSRRTIRIVASFLVILIGSASTIFSYDASPGQSITDTLVKPGIHDILDY